MGVRVGSSHFLYNYMISLNNAYQDQEKLFEQSDGSSLHRGSDNPINYSKYMRYTVSENENDQYRENIKTAASWMQNTDSVMVHMTDIMQTLKEKSTHAANSDNSEDDYLAIYKEMFAGMQEIVASLNTQVGDRYIFAGQKDLTKPFEMSIETYERGLAKNLDTAQAAFFKGSSSDYNTELFQFLEVKKGDDTFYLDTDSGNLYTKDFVDKGYKEVITRGCKTITAAQNSSDDNVLGILDKNIVGTATDFKVSNYFTNQGLFKDEYVTSVEIDGEEYTFATIRQNIVSYMGDESLISMVKLNGSTDPSADTVNTTGARMFGRDIFDNASSGNEPSGTAMLNDLFCVCEKVHACDTHWMSSDGMTVADVAHATVVVEETKIGAQRQLFSSALEMLDTQADNITESKTNVSSTDIAELAMKLMQSGALYNLALSIGGKILPQSLADYI